MWQQSLAPALLYKRSASWEFKLPIVYWGILIFLVDWFLINTLAILLCSKLNWEMLHRGYGGEDALAAHIFFRSELFCLRLTVQQPKYNWERRSTVWTVQMFQVLKYALTVDKAGLLLLVVVCVDEFKSSENHCCFCWLLPADALVDGSSLAVIQSDVDDLPYVIYPDRNFSPGRSICLCRLETSPNWFSIEAVENLGLNSSSLLMNSKLPFLHRVFFVLFVQVIVIGCRNLSFIEDSL